MIKKYDRYRALEAISGSLIFGVAVKKTGTDTIYVYIPERRCIEEYKTGKDLWELNERDIDKLFSNPHKNIKWGESILEQEARKSSVLIAFDYFEAMKRREYEKQRKLRVNKDQASKQRILK